MNFLPNSQWQLWSGTEYRSFKMRPDGSARQAPIRCTSFLTTNNAPTFLTPDTGDLKAGDLVVIDEGKPFWRYSGMRSMPSESTAVRVTTVVPNVSFTAGPCPLCGVSPATSYPVVISNISAGDYGASMRSADGWVKDSTLWTWPDDHPVNAFPGALRVLGCKKGTATAEELWWEAPPVQYQRYARRITFGVIVKGSGFTPWIWDEVNKYVYPSAPPIPLENGYCFSVVTAVPAASEVCVGLSFNGSVGDVCYVALPTAAFGSTMTPDDCAQNPNETIRSVCHWNPPLLTPLAMTFPNVVCPGSPWYGYAGQDIEAMSLGACHRSVAAVKAKIEFSGGCTLLTVSEASQPRGTCVFGPEVLAPGATNGAWLPLTQDGTFGIFVDKPQAQIGNATFDFDSVQLSSPSLSLVD